jgi:hypothetical protein
MLRKLANLASRLVRLEVNVQRRGMSVPLVVTGRVHVVFDKGLLSGLHVTLPVGTLVMDLNVTRDSWPVIRAIADVTLPFVGVWVRLSLLNK